MLTYFSHQISPISHPSFYCKTWMQQLDQKKVIARVDTNSLENKFVLMLTKKSQRKVIYIYHILLRVAERIEVSLNESIFCLYNNIFSTHS